MRYLRRFNENANDSVAEAEGNRTRRRTSVEKKYIPKMVRELKDKPIHQVRITAGKPVR